MLSSEDIRVSKYRSNDEFKEFQCEKKGYSDFVQDPNEALKYYRENLGVTYVFKFKGTPVGFVTLAMASLRKKDLPKERREQKPFRDVPSLLLGHMARDSRFKGEGVGRIMIDWVLLTAHRLADEVGCRFVVLDAEKDKVELYRSEYGFELIPPDKASRLSLMYFDLGLR